MVVSFNFLCRADAGNLDREIRNEQERAFLGEKSLEKMKKKGFK